MINLWLREEDAGLLDHVCKVPLTNYYEEIAQGSLDNPGFLGGLGKHFVLGKEGVWIPKGTDHKYHFVRIDNNSMYSNGLILTPYSGIDVDYHLKTKRVDRTTKFERVELEGMDTENFVKRVFRTYFGIMVRKFNERDQHFLLYSLHTIE